MAALGGVGIVAHGGVTGLAVELSLALLILAIGLAAWVGARREKE
jgi:hypothetical protein